MIPSRRARSSLGRSRAAAASAACTSAHASPPNVASARRRPGSPMAGDDVRGWEARWWRPGSATAGDGVRGWEARRGTRRDGGGGSWKAEGRLRPNLAKEEEGGCRDRRGYTRSGGGRTGSGKKGRPSFCFDFVLFRSRDINSQTCVPKLHIFHFTPHGNYIIILITSNCSKKSTN
jgi:hypothetical protein